MNDVGSSPLTTQLKRL